MGLRAARLLFTRADRAHVHKLLGVASLAHYAYRFSGHPFGPSMTEKLGCAALHAALSLSSLVFHLPRSRLGNKWMIWPEYRLHSIIFALRHIAAMVLYWHQEWVLGASRTGVEVPRVSRWLAAHYAVGRVAIVLATLLAADAASMSVKHRSNSVRDSTSSLRAQFMMASLQFLATTGVLLGRHPEDQMLPLLNIQGNAFIATLRRKGVISEVFARRLYQVLLGGALLPMVIWDIFNGISREPALSYTIWHGSVLLRLGLGLNKYVVWGLCSMYVLLRRAPRNQSGLLYNELPDWRVMLTLGAALHLYHFLRPERPRDCKKDGDDKAQ